MALITKQGILDFVLKMNVTVFLALFVNYSNVAVTRPPTDTTTAILEGEKLILPCILPPGTKDNNTVVWTFNDIIVSEDDNVTLVNDSQRFHVSRPHESDWFLNIHPTRKSDVGVYTCTMDNTTLNSHYVVIEYPPTVVGFRSRDVYFRLCVGTPRLTMWCNVTGVPRPVIRWFFLKTEREEPSYIGLSSQFANLVNAELINSGLYRCEAENRHGKDSLTYHITVIERITRMDGEEEPENLVRVPQLGEAGTAARVLDTRVNRAITWAVLLYYVSHIL